MKSSIFIYNVLPQYRELVVVECGQWTF